MKNSKKLQKNFKKSNISHKQVSLDVQVSLKCHMLPMILLSFVMMAFTMMLILLSQTNPSTNCQSKNQLTHQMIFQVRKSIIHYLVLPDGFVAVVSLNATGTGTEGSLIISPYSIHLFLPQRPCAREYSTILITDSQGASFERQDYRIKDVMIVAYSG